MTPVKHAWARWVLFGVNVLLSICSTGLFFVAALFAFGERFGLIPALAELAVIAVIPVMFAVLARQQRHRRGILFQTTIAIISMFAALIGHTIYPAIYGGYALLAVWVLGDFIQPGAPRTTLTGQKPSRA